MDVRDGHRVSRDVVGHRKPGHAGTGYRQRIEFVQARCGVPQEQLILAAVEVMIEAQAALIVIVDSDLGRFVDLIWSVGERVELLRLESDRADQGRRNHVIRELLSGELIDEWYLLSG